jgi:two-component system invasion response regulator UvrY
MPRMRAFPGIPAWMYERISLIRLVIADDHELIREGIKKIVRPSADLKIVGEAGDLHQALTLIAQVRPDVAVLDISLPDADGLDGLAALRCHFPALRVVMLSMHPEQRYAAASLRAGALAYVPKGVAASELVEAVRSAARGEIWISPRAQAAANDAPSPAHHQLTPREREIVVLIGAGLQIKQVAGELAISVSSVNTYRSRIFRKMGLNSNAALIRYAVQHGLTR